MQYRNPRKNPLYVQSGLVIYGGATLTPEQVADIAPAYLERLVKRGYLEERPSKPRVYREGAKPESKSQARRLAVQVGEDSPPSEEKPKKKRRSRKKKVTEE